MTCLHLLYIKFVAGDTNGGVSVWDTSTGLESEPSENSPAPHLPEFYQQKVHNDCTNGLRCVSLNLKIDWWSRHHVTYLNKSLTLCMALSVGVAKVVRRSHREDLMLQD